MTLLLFVFFRYCIAPQSFRNLIGSIGRQRKLPHDGMWVTVDMPVGASVPSNCGLSIAAALAYLDGANEAKSDNSRIAINSDRFDPCSPLGTAGFSVEFAESGTGARYSERSQRVFQKILNGKAAPHIRDRIHALTDLFPCRLQAPVVGTGQFRCFASSCISADLENWHWNDARVPEIPRDSTKSKQPNE